MTQHTIDATAVYDLEGAGKTLGMSPRLLSREAREGRLRVARRANRYFILGEWILEWLKAGEVKAARSLHDDLPDDDDEAPKPGERCPTCGQVFRGAARD